MRPTPGLAPRALTLALLLLLGTADNAARRRTIGDGSARDARPNAHAAQGAPAARFKIDASRSSFTVRAYAGGVLWFKGHDHIVRVREFAGDVTLAPPSLALRVRADSLAETRDVFTEQQKQIINREMREIVLEADKYPEITFVSTSVRLDPSAGPPFKAEIEGDLTLHGVTRRITVPAEVSSAGGELRARGEFSIKRSDFRVKATSAFHGTVRVRDRLKFTFDIVAVG